MEHEVLVFCGEEAPDRQPETFRFCPLGIQFYSRKQLPEYQQIRINLGGTAGVPLPEGAQCEGIVVHCEFDRHRGMYRNWILFVDLPDEIRRQFQCFAKQAGTTCPHCMNF